MALACADSLNMIVENGLPWMSCCPCWLNKPCKHADSATRATALARLAEDLSNEGELERALDLAKEAVAESEKSGLLMVKVEALFALGYLLRLLNGF